MATQNIAEDVSIIKSEEMTFVEHEGQILFSTEEIGKHLGFRSPSKSVNIIFSRNQRELDAYATGIKLMQVDGCMRQVRCFTEEGVYIISMLASTPRAREFRAKFARLLRELRERQISLAREAGYMQGRDEALALPQAEAARKQAYLQGLQEGERRQKQRDTGELYRRITAWRQKGLNWEECSLLAGYAKGSGGARRLCRRMERAVARATQEPTAEVTHV